MANIYEKQSVTDVSSAQLGQIGNPLIQQGREQKSQAEATENKARKKYKTQLENEAFLSMNEAMQVYGSDPEKFSSELTKLRGTMVKEIADDDVKADFLADFDLKSQTLLGKSRIQFAEAQKKEAKLVSQVNFDHNIDLAVDTLTNGLGQNMTPDDFVNFSRSMEVLNTTNDMTDDNGMPLYTQSEKLKNTYKKQGIYRTAINNYTKGLSEEEKYRFQKDLAEGKVTIGNRPLRDIMDKESYTTITSDAANYIQNFEKAVENGEKESRAADIASTFNITRKVYADFVNDNTKTSSKDGKKQEFNPSDDDCFNVIYNLDRDYMNGMVDEKTYYEYKEKFADHIMDKMEKERSNRDNMFERMFTNNREDAFNLLDAKLKKAGVTDRRILASLYSSVYTGLIANDIDPNSTNWGWVGKDTSKKLNEVVDKVMSQYGNRLEPAAQITTASKILTGKNLIDIKQDLKPVSSNSYKVYKDNVTGKRYRQYATGEKVEIK